MVDTQVRAQVSDRPKPLYFSTASQLGFHKTRGVPALLDALLPPSGESQMLLAAGSLICALREVADHQYSGGVHLVWHHTEVPVGCKANAL